MIKVSIFIFLSHFPKEIGLSTPSSFPQRVFPSMEAEKIWLSFFLPYAYSSWLKSCWMSLFSQILKWNCYIPFFCGSQIQMWHPRCLDACKKLFSGKNSVGFNSPQEQWNWKQVNGKRSGIKWQKKWAPVSGTVCNTLLHLIKLIFIDFLLYTVLGTMGDPKINWT